MHYIKDHVYAGHVLNELSMRGAEQIGTNYVSSWLQVRMGSLTYTVRMLMSFLFSYGSLGEVHVVEVAASNQRI